MDKQQISYSAILWYMQDNKMLYAFNQIKNITKKEPNFLIAWIDLSRILILKKHYKIAIKILETVVNDNINCLEAYNLLGDAYFATANFNVAFECYKKALEIDKNSNIALFNMALFLSETNNIDGALAIYSKLLKIDKRNSSLVFNLAVCLLKSGNFKDGFKFYESRFYVDKYPIVEFLFPKLSGANVQGKKILVLAEQGFGDEIQFVRYLRVLKELGAIVHYVCKPELKLLFQNSNIADEVINDNEYIGNYDAYCFLLSLPKILNIDVKNFNNSKYLSANLQKIDFFKQKLPLQKLKIGLARRGNTKNKPYNFRDIKDFNFLKPVFDLDATLIGLDNKKDSFWQGCALEFCNDIKDFDDLAALIECLDVVIATDTAVVHLAGALGKKTALLIPKYASCWRWQVETSECMWYKSVKIFRQKEQESWDIIKDAIKEVIEYN